MGNTATAASAIPAPFARLWELSRERRTAEGLELYRTLAPLREAYSVAGGQAQVVKRLMDRAGLRGGAVRPPARPADGTVDRLLGTLVASLAAEGLWTTLS